MAHWQPNGAFKRDGFRWNAPSAFNGAWRPDAADSPTWANGACNGAWATQWRGIGAFKSDDMPLAHEMFEGGPLDVGQHLRPPLHDIG